MTNCAIFQDKFLDSGRSCTVTSTCRVQMALTRCTCRPTGTSSSSETTRGRTPKSGRAAQEDQPTESTRWRSEKGTSINDVCNFSGIFDLPPLSPSNPRNLPSFSLLLGYPLPQWTSSGFVFNRKNPRLWLWSRKFAVKTAV